MKITPMPTPVRPLAAHAQAEKLLEQGKLDEAVALLTANPSLDSDPRTRALLGAAYFRQEKYQAAATAFEDATTLDDTYAGLAEQARQNLATDIAHDHAANPFLDEVVKGAPRPGPAAPEVAREIPVARSALATGLAVAGKMVGAISGAAVGVACRLLGNEKKGEVWTTWSRKNFVQGLLMLKNHRDRLNHNNLYDTYPEGELTGFAEPGQTQPEWTRYNRTFDGSWNNAANPKEGAAGTRFGRIVPREKTFQNEKMLMVPNPRLISRILQTRKDNQVKEVPFLNLLALWWIQMETHDWVSHGDNRNSDLMQVPLAPDDPKRQQLHMTHMLVPKTADDPTRKAHEANTPQTYLNEVTHWWDGSQLYGSSAEKAATLRSFKDGKMALDEDGNLPVGKDGVEMTGFNRNWTLGLAMMHTMFVKEHNAICDMLKASYPEWNDDQLFHKARLINSALMAKIHTTEWTPNVLPNKMLHSAMLANWYGALTKLFKPETHRKALADFNIADEVSGGLVGNKTEKYGVPAWLSEEFVSDYAILHSLLPDTLQMKSIDGGPTSEVGLNDIRQKKSHQLMKQFGQANVFHSFGCQHPGQLVLNNYPSTLQNLSVPGFGFFDMAAVDVLRDRERGVPRYNEMRRCLGLEPIQSFEDLTSDPETLADLKKVYNYDIEQIDFKIGCLAETQRPENFGFGETMFTIFILHASRRLQADRFFTESFNAETYTPEGLKWLDENGSKSVAMRHYPELGKTGLANHNVTTIFEPFDTDPDQLNDPARHPLAFVRR
ncbi:MAG: peroxidase family protein [Vulcanimicrobiota bacterium]